MKRKVAITIAIFVFVLALCVTVYPLISNYYQAGQQSEVYSEYTETVSSTAVSEIEAEREKAKQYNKSIVPVTDTEVKTDLAAYNSLLNISGNGIMGYVNIEKLNVHLPIHHTADAKVLESGVGHLEFTSLPVGGESTHSVLTAHSGMASQRLFSDLDILEKGDTFYLEVLGEKLYYEVRKISTVLPYEIDNLKIETGKDLVSLVTCTPFGVNTHRLIVTAERIEVLEELTSSELTDEAPRAQEKRSTWETEYLKAIFVGIGIFASVLILYISVGFIKKKSKRRESSKSEKNFV